MHIKYIHIYMGINRMIVKKDRQGIGYYGVLYSYTLYMNVYDY